jgi:beta-galactosidase/beta-glucuronidase
VRSARSLDGIWDARLDPTDDGLAGGWFGPTAPFDRQLTVPLPWQAADPALRKYAGVVWYRRTFAVPAEWRGGAVALCFGAVDYAAAVWVNGVHVGRHEGGYTPFEIECGGAVSWDGPNTVTVRVFDPADVADIPHGKQGGRWYTPVSGPWQPVSLVVRPRERIERMRCVPDAAQGTVSIAVTARGLDGPRAVDLEIREIDSGQVVATGRLLLAAEAATAHAQIVIPEPRLWEPASPHLYTVRATLRPIGGPGTAMNSGIDSVLDTFEDRFGLRTVEVRGGTLLLNGHPLYLRGALDQSY